LRRTEEANFNDFSVPVLFGTAKVFAALQVGSSGEEKQWCSHSRYHNRATTMKNIASALVALSVLASNAGLAEALDTQIFYKQQERAR
jgi:hypothetical protein